MHHNFVCLLTFTRKNTTRGKFWYKIDCSVHIYFILKNYLIISIQINNVMNIFARHKKNLLPSFNETQSNNFSEARHEPCTKSHIT